MVAWSGGVGEPVSGETMSANRLVSGCYKSEIIWHVRRRLWLDLGDLRGWKQSYKGVISIVLETKFGE